MVASSVIHTGTMAGIKARIVPVLELLGRFPLALLQLLFRLAVASVFLKAAMTKLASWEFTIQLFADEYKVPVLPPEIAAVFATTTELTCSVLLIAGLFTRLATLPLLGMIMVIQIFVYPSAYSEHLTWGSILLFLLTRGGGPISLDRLFGLEPPASRRS
jgi:putative oxidoreductase